MYIRFGLCVCFLVCLALMRAGFSNESTADFERSLADWSGPWQLFVDDYLIEKREHLTRSYHPFQKHPANPLPGGDRFGTRDTVLPQANGSGYQAWAKGKLLTSRDGIDWTGPATRLEFLNFEGTRNGSLIHTPWDGERRFKLVSYDYTLWKKVSRDPTEKGGGRYGSYSSDGIHWMDLPDNPLFPDRTDTGRFNWDPLRRRYFGTPKIFTNVHGLVRRCVGFSASADFEPGWPTAEMILLPDRIDDRWVTRAGQRTEFYSLSAFVYESMYIGLLEVFRNTDGWKDGTIHIELVSSRDGIHWKRQEGERNPVIPLGGAGSWDSGMIKVPSHPIVEDGLVKVYYKAGNYTHGFGRNEYESHDSDGLKRGGLGLATLRKDGFASLDAAEPVGNLTTRPLHGATGSLAVNFKTQPQGWLKVEVLDENGRVMPGYSLAECPPLSGDELSQTVSWNNRSILPGEGRPIRLRFVLQHASLFSFRTTDPLRVEASPAPLAILFTFEGDHGKEVTDQLAGDGIQSAFLRNAVIVDDNNTQPAVSAPAAFGESSLMFLGDGSQYGQYLRAQSLYAGNVDATAYHEGFQGDTKDTLEIENSFQLGSRFTLSAMVYSFEQDHTRLFSSWEPYPVRVNEAPYERTAWSGMKELVFDFDPSGQSEFGCLRLVVHGAEVRAACSFGSDRYHHLAATYDDGAVVLYLDGARAGEGQVPGGPVALLANLHVGEDPGPFTNNSTGQTGDEQLKGYVDDILIWGEPLADSDMRELAEDGAEAYFSRSAGTRNADPN